MVRFHHGATEQFPFHVGSNLRRRILARLEPISQHHGVTPKDDDRGILIDDEMSEMPLHAEIRACQSTLQSNRVHGTGAVRFRWVHAIMLGSQLQKRPGHDAMSHEFNGECGLARSR